MLKNRKLKSIFEIFFFLVLFLVSINFSLKIHHWKGRFQLGKRDMADKAGYYIYLPALFFFHFDANRCPEKIDEKTGNDSPSIIKKIK